MLHVHELIGNYGAATLFAVVCLEAMGAPLPGESALIAFALYTGLHPQTDIATVIAAAAAGAIVGDNIGYEVGRRFGFRLLRRYGTKIRLTACRLKIGQYLFRRYGGWIVFFGRFAAILRTFAAVLAGANCMPWRRFFVCNAIGALAWASLYAGGAYFLGRSVNDLSGPFAILAVAAALAVILGSAIFFRRHEARLILAAEQTDPDSTPA